MLFFGRAGATVFPARLSLIRLPAPSPNGRRDLGRMTFQLWERLQPRCFSFCDRRRESYLRAFPSSACRHLLPVGEGILAARRFNCRSGLSRDAFPSATGGESLTCALFPSSACRHLLPMGEGILGQRRFECRSGFSRDAFRNEAGVLPAQPSLIRLPALCRVPHAGVECVPVSCCSWSAWSSRVNASTSSSRSPATISGSRYKVRLIRWSVIRPCGKL